MPNGCVLIQICSMSMPKIKLLHPAKLLIFIKLSQHNHKVKHVSLSNLQSQLQSENCKLVDYKICVDILNLSSLKIEHSSQDKKRYLQILKIANILGDVKIIFFLFLINFALHMYYCKLIQKRWKFYILVSII